MATKQPPTDTRDSRKSESLSSTGCDEQGEQDEKQEPYIEKIDGEWYAFVNGNRLGPCERATTAATLRDSLSD